MDCRSSSWNRILLGVIDNESVQVMEAVIQDHGIPPHAVEVQVVPELELHQQLTLQSQHDTIVGGLRVRLPRATGFTMNCTLTGVAVESPAPDSFAVDGARYLVTNSHCTEQFGTVTGVKMYQASQPRQVGVEFIDPPLRGSGTLPGCPTTLLRCRLSDAALFHVDDGGESVFGVNTAFDSVAWAGWNGNISYHGRWPLNGRQASVWAGQNVQKVGSQTGTTSGHVVDTCLLHSVFTGNTPPYPRHYVCHIGASYESQSGDSGAPVSHISSPWNRIVGIHSGRRTYDGERIGVFSWILYAESELASEILAQTGTLWTPVLTASPLVY
jgi:hypothetical protein